MPLSRIVGNFQNTKRAYRLLTSNELVRQKFLYGLGTVLSHNSVFASECVNKFMHFKPPYIYPKMQTLMFNQFCGGEDLSTMIPMLDELQKEQITPLLSFGVEYSTNNEELDKSKDNMMELIDFVQDRGHAICKATSIMSCERLKRKQLGDLSQNDQEDWSRDLKRLEEVTEYAVHKNVPLFFDAETIGIQSEIHNQVIRLMRGYNKGCTVPRIYSTIQFYRKDSQKQLDDLIEDSEIHSYMAGLKLVRGAYMQDEENEGNRSFLFETKEETDDSYNMGITKCINNMSHMGFLVATHNENSIKHLIEEIDKRDIQRNAANIRIAQMYGMRRDITFNLSGFNVSLFIPYGPEEKLFPYLVRRGLENSSALSGCYTEFWKTKKELSRRHFG